MVPSDGTQALIWWHDSEEVWKFAPSEQPATPGAPANQDHSLGLRFAYAAVAALVGIMGGLGNALVLDNLPQLQGALGAYLYEIAWLPVAYVMTNFAVNLLMIKFRERFGLRLFTGGFVALYALVTLGHLFLHTFKSAIAVRAASGMAGAALTTLAIYYMIQALPAKWRINAVVIGLGLPQLATPLPRLFPTEPLAFGEWRTLHALHLRVRPRVDHIRGGCPAATTARQEGAGIQAGRLSELRPICGRFGHVCCSHWRRSIPMVDGHSLAGRRFDQPIPSPVRVVQPGRNDLICPLQECTSDSSGSRLSIYLPRCCRPAEALE